MRSQGMTLLQYLTKQEVLTSLESNCYKTRKEGDNQNK